jgi:hypothetical protein
MLGLAHSKFKLMTVEALKVDQFKWLCMSKTRRKDSFGTWEGEGNFWSFFQICSLSLNLAMLHSHLCRQQKFNRCYISARCLLLFCSSQVHYWECFNQNVHLNEVFLKGNYLYCFIKSVVTPIRLGSKITCLSLLKGVETRLEKWIRHQCFSHLCISVFISSILSDVYHYRLGVFRGKTCCFIILYNLN